MLIAALARRWALTAVAVVVTVTIAAVVASSFVAVETSAAIRVMSMNMQFGKADTSEILRLAKRDDDVLAVQEDTEGRGTPVGGRFGRGPPPPVDRPSTGPSGVGLWGSFPLTETARVETHKMPAVVAPNRRCGSESRRSVDTFDAAVHL